MFPTILHRVGLAACLLLIISCFLPWAYFADPHIIQEADRTFTGFYSYQNNYGKPGKLLVTIGIIVIALMLLPKVWAKRTNLFVCALAVGYAVKTYILFVSCYNAYCPEKKAGNLPDVSRYHCDADRIRLSGSKAERSGHQKAGINPA